MTKREKEGTLIYPSPLLTSYLLINFIYACLYTIKGKMTIIYIRWAYISKDNLNG